VHIGVTHATEQNLYLHIMRAYFAALKVEGGQGRVRRFGGVAFYLGHGVGFGEY
jgi:hypothetical protein